MSSERFGKGALAFADGLKYRVDETFTAVVLDFFLSPGCCIAVLGGTPDERCPSRSGGAEVNDEVEVEVDEN